jgi:hypothetical protein
VRLEWGHHWRETLHCLETNVEIGGGRLTINLELLCLSIGAGLFSVLFINLHTLFNQIEHTSLT